jgi:hypothetical protein
MLGELDETRVRAAYQAELRPLLGELRVARGLARLLYDHPWVRRWIFRRIGQRLVDAITDVCLGARTYGGSITGLLAALARRPFEGHPDRLRGERSVGDSL